MEAAVPAGFHSIQPVRWFEGFLFKYFIPVSNLSLRCHSVHLLNLPHKQLNDRLSSLGNLWPPGNSKLK